jgi:hypothetical protein
VEVLRLPHELQHPRHLPAGGDGADVGVDQLDVLVPRESEVHEPLPVDQPSHLFQDLDPPPVIVEFVVECTESCGHLPLNIPLRQVNLKGTKDLCVSVGLSHTTGNRSDPGSEILRLDDLAQEARLDLLRIRRGCRLADSVAQRRNPGWRRQG